MTEKIAVLLTQKEKRLVEELRRIKYGEVVVFQVEGQPVEISRVKEKIRL